MRDTHPGIKRAVAPEAQRESQLIPVPALPLIGYLDWGKDPAGSSFHISKGE